MFNNQYKLTNLLFMTALEVVIQTANGAVSDKKNHQCDDISFWVHLHLYLPQNKVQHTKSMA